jgi:gamma-glutamyltranspeptidase/glutathione hydrolase
MAVCALLSPLSACGQRRTPVQPRPPKTGDETRSRLGIVASSERHASEAGAEILRRGGNAVDAAVATGLALAVTYPTAGNLGGGGFMLIRMADGRTNAIDYREVAPLAASRTMYLDAAGERKPGGAREGRTAAGVPGTVAGLELALRKYGTMSWAEVVEPARRLAAEGFPVSEDLARELREVSSLAADPESRRVFQRDGRTYEAGEILAQPDLAATLERLKTRGPKEFYQGETARLLVEDMKRGGGIITREDLKRYRPVERKPVRGIYRDHEIITMPPPSSGGVAVLQMLGILTGLGVEPDAPAAERAHLLVEAMRRAFADRARYMGDPDFVKVPVKQLLDETYTEKQALLIHRSRATPSAEVASEPIPGYESPQTTHFSVVDRWGNAVANTYTLNEGYGSGIMVKGAGFLLNNEMDDFTSKPGAPNMFGLIQGEANAIAPRKRPLSSMTPTIVLKGGKLFLVLGSPGGPTIINSVFQVLLNVIDGGMRLPDAVAAPRLHHQWMPDTLTHESSLPDALAAELTRRGHVLRRVRSIGDVQAIHVEPATGDRVGVSDPRSRDGKAAAQPER